MGSKEYARPTNKVQIDREDWERAKRICEAAQRIFTSSATIEIKEAVRHSMRRRGEVGTQGLENDIDVIHKEVNAFWKDCGGTIFCEVKT